MTCIIPGDPVAWARPIPIKGGAVTQNKQARHKNLIMLYLRQIWGQRPPIPMGQPVELSCVFVFKGKPAQYGKPKATRPDADNLLKQVSDALQGKTISLVIEDDGQIWWKSAMKVYGEQAHTVVRVKWFTGTNGDPTTLQKRQKA